MSEGSIDQVLRGEARWHVAHGDCVHQLRELANDIIDAIVCDPPYFLVDESGKGFMSKKWDSLPIAAVIVAACFRCSHLVSSTVEDGAAAENANTTSQNEAERSPAQPVERASFAASSRTLDTARSSAAEHVITRDEALALCHALFPDLTDCLRSAPTDVRFALSTSFLDSESTSIAPRLAYELRRAPRWLEQLTQLSNTDSAASTRDATAARSGTTFDAASTSETTGLADAAEPSVERARSSATTSSHTEFQETIRRATSSRSVRAAIRRCTSAPGITGTISEWWHERWAREAFRVLKPGGHAAVFGGTRTFHRVASALEAVGFEKRDSIGCAAPVAAWVHGQGFPKSLNVEAAITALEETGGSRPEDLRRVAMGEEYAPSGRGRVNYDHGSGSAMNGQAAPSGARGTALKPSWEPILLVRKPIAGSVAENVLEHGTGALNIDACRVAHAGAADLAAHQAQVAAVKARGGSMENSWKNSSDLSGANDVNDAGRWPPNAMFVHHDGCVQVGTSHVKAHPTWDTPNRETESSFTGSTVSQVRHGDGETEEVPVWKCVEGCPVRELDAQSGELKSGYLAAGTPRANRDGFHGAMPEKTNGHASSSGTASRFFPQFQRSELDDIAFRYAPKASRGERDRGLEHFSDGNVHPTVKLVELLRWLVRLTTPRGGIVLDLFAGSGSCGVAAILEGARYLGIELNDTDEEPFVSIARARLAHACGYEFVPRESLRTAKPPRQQSLFGAME